VSAHAVALALLAVASCWSPRGLCADAEPDDNGVLLGTLRARGVTWRVQTHDLPDGCDGLTTWSPTRHTVTFAGHPSRATALHEVGHVLLGPQHLADASAVMHSPYRATDIAQADIAHCVGRLVCPPGARVLALPSVDGDEPSPVAWAALRWSSVARPEFRSTYSPAGAAP